MTVEEIPSDKLVIMNSEWHRMFNAAGCDPACHNCGKFIKGGNEFKLSTIKKLSSSVWGWGLENAIKLLKGVLNKFKWEREVTVATKEVMLCDKCTPQMFLNKQITSLEKDIAERDRKGCFRINGKIIH